MATDESRPARVVLVVEDEPGIRSALELLLGLEGYEVLTASNGVEALEVLAHARCDVLVTDHMMPVMDGMLLLAHLRDDPRLSTMPRILMSAVSRPRDVRPLAHAFVAKPFETSTLLRAIEALLDGR